MIIALVRWVEQAVSLADTALPDRPVDLALGAGAAMKLPLSEQRARRALQYFPAVPHDGPDLPGTHVGVYDVGV